MQNEKKTVAGGQVDSPLLDFDFFIEGGDLALPRIGDYLDLAHARTKKVFESLISDSYRQLMKGDVSCCGEQRKPLTARLSLRSEAGATTTFARSLPGSVPPPGCSRGRIT